MWTLCKFYLSRDRLVQDNNITFFFIKKASTTKADNSMQDTMFANPAKVDLSLFCTRIRRLPLCWRSSRTRRNDVGP